jgi:small subunit ribosomal protein S17
MLENERNARRTKIGVVVSDKMDKTITVAVIDNKRHPLYGKVFKQTKKYKVHDEQGVAHVGDTVEIMETRHISKDKYFRLVRIIEKAK